MSNSIKEKNPSIIIAIKDFVSSMMCTFKELSSNSEEKEDIKLEEQVNELRKMEDSDNIKNLENMLRNIDSDNTERKNKYKVNKVNTKKIMQTQQQYINKDVEKEIGEE